MQEGLTSILYTMGTTTLEVNTYEKNGGSF